MRKYIFVRGFQKYFDSKNVHPEEVVVNISANLALSGYESS